MKDITFELESLDYNNYNYRVKIFYGGKKVINFNVRNEDVAEVKLAVLAVQNEIMKDVNDFLIKDKISLTEATNILKEISKDIKGKVAAEVPSPCSCGK